MMQLIATALASHHVVVKLQLLQCMLRERDARQRNKARPHVCADDDADMTGGCCGGDEMMTGGGLVRGVF